MKKQSSVKSFGILFFLVFLIVGLWPLLNDKEIRIWSIILSIMFLVLGLTKSRILIPLNNYWIKLGEILGKKQSGSPSVYVADLSFDYDLLEDAKIMVEDILSKNPKLENIEGENLRNLLYLQERDAAILTLTAG